jgi:hypothetical protein
LDESFDPTRIPKAIRDAGFSLRDLAVQIQGILTQGKEFLELTVEGLEQPFLLAGGIQVDELEKRSDLLGKRIQITGQLHPSHANEPPSLTVEEYQSSR